MRVEMHHNKLDFPNNGNYLLKILKLGVAFGKTREDWLDSCNTCTTTTQKIVANVADTVHSRQYAK